MPGAADFNFSNDALGTGAAVTGTVDAVVGWLSGSTKNDQNNQLAANEYDAAAAASAAIQQTQIETAAKTQQVLLIVGIIGGLVFLGLILWFLK